MNTMLKDIPFYCPQSYLTDTELSVFLNKSHNSYYSKVKRLFTQGKLLHIRRGLYCLTAALGHPQPPHPFELAQHIYGPSYISLESALSFHKLIPEAVYAVTSVCTKRAKEFKTPLGLFNYMRIPVKNFYLDVELITEGHNRFFMAKPWKAICDYIFCYKKDWHGINPLSQSLRIDCENLPLLEDKEIELLEEYYRHNRISRFLKSIKRDLNL